MYITYHKSIEPKGELPLIPITILDRQLREFLSKHNCVQPFYKCYSNRYYFFLYLDNGDRVDIQLNN